MVWTTALSDCLEALSQQLNGVADAAVRHDFRAALAKIDLAPLEGGVAAPRARTALPVLRHWEAAVENAKRVNVELGKALDALFPALSWRQNPNYVRNPPSPDFLEAYGYAVIAGPGGPVAADVALGVLLLAPGLLYPAHAHPADEIYLVLDRSSRWWREGRKWQGDAAGAIIHHPPNLAHAMQAGSTPLCAVYLWRGAVEVHAALVPRGAGDYTQNPGS